MSPGHDLDASAPAVPSPASAPTRSRRRRRIALALALVVLIGVAAGTTLSYWWRRTEPESIHPDRHLPSDPRLLYQGPFGNLHPDVAYVGDDACTSCHREIAASYRKHPMGRSLQPIAAILDSEVYDKAHNNPFQTLGVRFDIERHGAEVWHRETYADVPGQPPIRSDFPVHFVMGSGTHGRSYLSNRDGYLFQTPISWFTQKQFWNLSPGFGRELLAGRPVDPSCLFCHANRAHPHEGTLNRFDAPLFSGHAIGCERCHGPGGRHIDSAQKLDIVNPTAKGGDKPLLTPELRDAVCEQCHLEGQERILRRGRGLYDFRPGLPLAEFFRVFVSAAEPGGERRAVSHVEQMRESRCYQRGKGDKKLGCVSCHNPHMFVPPAEQASFYRARCLKCHNGEDSPPCSEPVADRRRRQSDDSCIACHMQRFRATDIAHTAATDHRVPRRPAPEPKGEPHSQGSPLLASFYDKGAPDSEPELARDLGVALVKVMWKHKDGRPRGSHALALLETALRNDPEDVAAWQAKGEGLMLTDRLPEALAAFQSLLRLAPEQESALVGAATLTQKLGRLEESLDYWRRSIAVNGQMPMYRGNYALLLEYAKRWDETRVQCQAWMRLEPNNVEARKLWIICLLREGNKEEARAEFARITSLKPPNLGELQIWFRRQMR